MLTPNHRSHIAVALGHVEQGLEEAIALLSGGDQDALFPRYRDFPDAARITRTRAHLARVRAAMRRFMDAQGIDPAGVTTVDAAWAFETHVSMLRDEVIELRPSYLRGYGELDEAGALACRALAAELGQLLDQMTGELRRGPLQWPAEGVSDALLEATAQVIERQRLLEYRSRVEALLAHAGETAVEVALLGRVSSGKSSLVNTLLGQALLPVGAVPVTAVTTRIRYGEAVAARTIDIDGHGNAIAPAELGNYIDEAGNPGNRLRLREVELHCPAEWLRQGVILTDTPGLGSLHAQASAHALDYLPRCDLGIVTIDAASTLTPQDVDLVRALRDAHAGWLVVLSKSDSVATDALAQQHAYVERALAEALGETVAIADVSVLADRRVALDAWRSGVLEPALATARVAGAARQRARVVALAERVVEALRQGLAERQPHGATTDAPTSAGGELAQLEEVARQARTLCHGLATRGASAVIEAVVEREYAAAVVTAQTLGERAAILADGVVSELVRKLREAAAAGGIDADKEVRGAPPFVLPDGLPATVPVPRGPGPLRRAWLRRRLRDAAVPPLDRAYAAYAREVEGWATATTRQMRRVFTGNATAAPVDAGEPARLAADLERLEALLAT